jgi:hypothetical protein
MLAAQTSETSDEMKLRTQQYIPEDSEVHTCCHENLKSHITLYSSHTSSSLSGTGGTGLSPQEM